MKRIYKRTGQVLIFALLVTLGVTHAYEWQINEGTTFSIGGDVELAYVHTDTGAGDTSELSDIGSEIEFSGTHAFTDGVSAYFAAEFEFPFDETEDSPFSTKAAIFGVRGNFGAVQIGDWDGVYEEHIEDFLLLDVMEEADISVTEDFRTAEEGNAIAYFSPSFNGLSFAVQGFFLGDDDDPSTTDGQGQAFQASLSYTMEPITVNLAYDNNGLDEGGDGTIGLAVGVGLSPVTLVAKIESVGGDTSPTDGPLDKEGFMLYSFGAQYDYGPGAINALVQQVAPDADNLDGRLEFGVNATYAIADNFYVFIEHTRYDRDNGAGNITAGGLVYAF